MTSQREYDEAELREAELRLADVTAAGRQTEPTQAGADFRASLVARIAELRARLEEEDDDDGEDER